MKLTATEVGNYLIRFYEAVAKRAGQKLPSSDFKIGVVEGISGPQPIIIFGKPNENLFIKLYVNPAWDQVMKFAHCWHSEELMSELAALAQYGGSYITVKLSNKAEVTRIPFLFTFDIKRDVENFIGRIDGISSIRLLFTFDIKRDVENFIGRIDGISSIRHRPAQSIPAQSIEGILEIGLDNGFAYAGDELIHVAKFDFGCPALD